MIRKILPVFAVFLALLLGCRESSGPAPNPQPPTLAPTISSLSATLASITAGTAVSLTATFSNGSGTIDHGVGAVTSGTPVPVIPLTTTTYTLTVTSASGQSAQATTTVTVVPAPQAQELRASTSSPLYGGTFTLTPVYADGTAGLDGSLTCPASGVATEPILAQWSGPRTYTLTVTNSLGATATISVIVTPQVVVVSPISSTGSFITTSQSISFTASVTGAQDTSLEWSVDGIPGGNATVGILSPGGLYTAPATPGTHTITARSRANAQVFQGFVVQVVLPPAFSSALVANPSAVAYGGSSTLSAAFINGVGRLTGGGVDQGVTSPMSWTTPALTATTTFLLTVTNPAGDALTGRVTVTVTPVLMTDLTAAPNLLTLTRSLQITGGQVSQAQNPAVVWSVNGVTGGNSTVGTLTATGLYTAPAVLPSPGSTVTIRCVSVTNPSVFRELALTLVPLPAIESFQVISPPPVR